MAGIERNRIQIRREEPKMRRWMTLAATGLLAAFLSVSMTEPVRAIDFTAYDEDEDDYDEYDEYDEEDDWEEEEDEDWEEEEDDWDEEDEDDWEEEEDEYDWGGAIFVYRPGGASGVDQQVFGTIASAFARVPSGSLDFGLFMGADGGNVDAILIAKPSFYTREGYAFTGWALYEVEGETWYCMDDEGWVDQADIDELGLEKYLVQPGEDLFPFLEESGSETVLVYAQWRRNAFTLAFDPGKKGKGKMASVSGSSEVRQTLPANGFTREGYVFEGWTAKRASDGAGFCGEEDGWLTKKERKEEGASLEVIPDRAIVTIPCEEDGDTITLTAKWKKAEAPAQEAAPARDESAYVIYD